MESGNLDGEMPQGSWGDGPGGEVKEGFVEKEVPDPGSSRLKLTLLHCACRSISRAWKVRFSSRISLWLLCTAVGRATSWVMAANCGTKQRAEALALGPLDLWGVWASFFYLLFIPVLMLLYYKLIFLPHVLQDLNQIFSRGCIHLHIDLEVIWHMMFFHFLFNNRERK